MVKNEQTKGAVLFLVVVYSLIFAFVGMSFIYLHGLYSISVAEKEGEIKSRWMAESGIEACKAWLIHTLYPDTAQDWPAAVNPLYSITNLAPESDSNTEHDAGEMSAHIYEYEVINSETHYYLISSTGTFAFTRTAIISKIKVNRMYAGAPWYPPAPTPTVDITTYTYRTDYWFEKPAERVNP